MTQLALALVLGVLLGASLNHGGSMHRIKSRLFGTRRRKVATVAVSLLLVGAGTALAAWLITGSGDGSGRVGTLSPVTFTAGPSAGNPGYPGTTGDISMTVHNPNGALVLSAVSPGGPATGTTCLGTGSSGGAYIRGRSVSGLSIPVPAGNSDIVIPDGVMVDADAPQSCSGQTFTIPFDGSLHTP